MEYITKTIEIILESIESMTKLLMSHKERIKILEDKIELLLNKPE